MPSLTAWKICHYIRHLTFISMHLVDQQFLLGVISNIDLQQNVQGFLEINQTYPHMVFKLNIFIVTHNVHKCTNGEILRNKTLCHSSISNNIWKMYNKQTTIFTQYTINNRQLYTIYNTHISIIYT